MRVLVACEFSGIVRDAFAARGHDAWSCDLLPSEKPGNHYLGDVLNHLDGKFLFEGRDGERQVTISDPWDLMIAHPPCTYLANSGVRWLYDKSGAKITERWHKVREAATFFRRLMKLSEIPRICMENPIPHRHAKRMIGSDYDQIIQPWQFGHGETKATCLWLKNLPKLVPTKIVEGRTPRVHHASPGPDRWKERSRTLQGIADAMAEQWGGLLDKVHDSDCAVHNEPALPAGPCDCGVDKPPAPCVWMGCQEKGIHRHRDGWYRAANNGSAG